MARTIGEGANTQPDLSSPEAHEGQRNFLSADMFLQADTIATRDIEIPSKGWMRVRALTSLEYQRYQRETMEFKGTDLKMRDIDGDALLVFYGAVNNDGTRMFTRDQIDRIGRKERKMVQIPANEIREMSGMTETKEEKTERKEDFSATDE